MKACIFLTVLSLGAITCLGAAAQQLPRFNIEATCKTAQPLTAEDRDPAKGCVQDETEAERQLQAIWSSSTAAHRETCTAETRIAGSPSYVDLLTCLQMFEGNISAAPQRRLRQP